jgi:diguanylate cyclase (GGDEF)-like protein
MDDKSAAWAGEVRSALVLCVVVCCTAWLGIFSRPMGDLASLWPANAVLLGAVLRYPHLATRGGWLGAVVGYFAADLSTGGTLVNTFWLTAANLVSVATGYALLSRLDPQHRRLELPLSVPYLGLCIAAAAVAAASIGALLDPILFGGSALRSWIFWFVTETVNYMAVLPVMLLLPRWTAWTERRHPRGHLMRRVRHAAPVASLALLCLLGAVVGGPGALAFPLPALLWCALRYSLFTTVVLNLVFSGWTLVALSLGFTPAGMLDITSRPMQLSLRLGVMLVGWGPLTVASVMAGRNALLRTMRMLAEYDQLSGLLNRRAFREHAQPRLNALVAAGRPAAMLMLDIDHFKSVNDRHGHAAGDAVLVAFAQIAKRALREGDLFSRLGGEEFAILLPDCGLDDALQIAERVRGAIAATPTALPQAEPLRVTVSIGCFVALPAVDNLDTLLAHADRALYRAKAAGRNRVDSECQQAVVA